MKLGAFVRRRHKTRGTRKSTLDVTVPANFTREVYGKRNQPRKGNAGATNNNKNERNSTYLQTTGVVEIFVIVLDYYLLYLKGSFFISRVFFFCSRLSTISGRLSKRETSQK